MHIPATKLLSPTWPAPDRVQACTTTRTGGVSQGNYASLNLSLRSGDDPNAVHTNRARLRAHIPLPQEPYWLAQVHGSRLLAAHTPQTDRGADASWTNQAGVVCAVMTADCLPVLFCADDSSCVAAAHAGWRGLAGGVLETTAQGLPVTPQRLLAWLGPAIGATAYEVGDEVRDVFLTHDPAADCGFTGSPNGRWYCDLYALARLRLTQLGISRIYGGDYCTFTEPALLYSYRRDGVASGRMASLIWLTP